ncbi:MAG: hypothetical protein WCG87_01785 [Bacteroidota bacterium]
MILTTRVRPACTKLMLTIMAMYIVDTASAASADSLKKSFHFEVSFGQSLLFISNSDVINIHNTAHIVIPTSSMLLFTELRSDKKIRIPVFFNIPISSKEFLVDGQLVYESASPTIGSGIEFKLFELKLPGKIKFDAEVGPLLSMVIDGKNSQLAPILAGRIRVMRGENFLMYLGCSYTMGLNTLGMFYGTGSVF